MDGLVVGAMIGLGAIGVTLTYSILRFANFAHGEFIAWGAYVALAAAAALGSVLAGGWPRRSGPSPSAGRCLAARAGDGADRRPGAGARRVLFEPLARGAARSSCW